MCSVSLQGLSCAAIGCANMGPSLRCSVTPLMEAIIAESLKRCADQQWGWCGPCAGRIPLASAMWFGALSAALGTRRTHLEVVPNWRGGQQALSDPPYHSLQAAGLHLPSHGKPGSRHLTHRAWPGPGAPDTHAAGGFRHARRQPAAAPQAAGAGAHLGRRAWGTLLLTVRLLQCYHRATIKTPY